MAKDWKLILVQTTPARKRRRTEDKNDLLPSAAPDDATQYGTLDFAEVLDPEKIAGHRTIVNRAPLMTAWASVVAERLGFAREEALSIGMLLPLGRISQIHGDLLPSFCIH